MNFLKRILNKFRPKSPWQIRQDRDFFSVKKFLSTRLPQDPVCIDIGANKGDFIELILKNTKNPKLYAFEPIPNLFSGLTQKYSSNVELYNLALGNHTEVRDFHLVLNDPAWSGFKRQNVEGKLDIEIIKVEVEKLDNLFVEIPQIDFIKIDVEGAELYVLEGAKETILKHKPKILFECANLHLKNYDYTAENIYDYITSELGLRIFSLNNTLVPLSKEAFLDVIEKSENSNYGKDAETNFVASELPVINRFVMKNYLNLIINSVNTNFFRNHFVEIDGQERDILEDGNISCAIFVSSILHLVGLIKRPHFTVKSTLKDIQESGWYEINDLKTGSLILWEDLYFETVGNVHSHLGFYIGENKAVSNLFYKKSPQIHDINFANDKKIGFRKIAKIFWHPKLDEKYF